jgi:hypothetical protein
MALGDLELSGTLRLDTDSFSADVGASLSWGILAWTLTVGFDPQGFKWIQLEIKARV